MQVCPFVFKAPFPTLPPPKRNYIEKIKQGIGPLPPMAWVARNFTLAPHCFLLSPASFAELDRPHSIIQLQLKVLNQTGFDQTKPLKLSKNPWHHLFQIKHLQTNCGGPPTPWTNRKKTTKTTGPTAPRRSPAPGRGPPGGRLRGPRPELRPKRQVYELPAMNFLFFLGEIFLDSKKQPLEVAIL